MPQARAFQFKAPGAVEIIDVETRPPAENEVGIRMIATSLCNHSELRSFRGGSLEGYGSHYPMLPGEPGHEGVGVVTEVGRAVTEFGVGDIVVLTGWGGDPAHRSTLIREAAQVARVIPFARDTAAASILEMFASAYHCVKAGWRDGPRFENARVAIIGMGAIGLCSLQIIRLWPVREILALETSAWKLDLARRLGADETVVVPADHDPQEVARGVERCDIVIECSGAQGGQMLANAFAPRMIINVSYVPQPFAVDQAKWFNAGTTIYNPGLPQAEDLRAIAALYNRRLIDPDVMISSRIKPTVEEYVRAIRDVEKGSVIKTLIEWGTQ